jgi:dihydropyrimidinase
MEKPNRIRIAGGTLVVGQTVQTGDILIEGEKIAAIGDLRDTRADITMDAAGLVVLPGAVDPHVHFNDTFMNTVSIHDCETGTRAAAFGGVTSVIDFSNQTHGGSLAQCLADKKAEAAGRALVDWGVHTVITDPTPQTIAEIPQIVAAGAPTLKCYMTYREDGLMIEIPDLEKIIGALRDAGGMLMVHAEDNDMIEANVPRLISEGKTAAFYHAVSRPPEVEEKAIQDCIDMVARTGGKLFVVHLASKRGMEMIGRARIAGLDIHAETCIHYLILTEEQLKRPDGIKWICSPPLRSNRIQAALWRGIRDDLIGLVSTDDAAFSWKAKLHGQDRFDQCPNGIPGIEVRLPLLYSEGVLKGRLTWPRLAALISTGPARMFGLWPRKGSLLPGADADIVLFDPAVSWTMNTDTLHMGADWCAYEGIAVKGRIQKVISRGEVIIDGERCLAEKGRGRYLHRSLNEENHQ